MKIMIVGAGQVGQYLAEKFSQRGDDVILIDRDESRLASLESKLNVMTVIGNGASLKVLAEAGIARVDMFIAVTDSDEVNMIACLISNNYDVNTRIARVSSEEFYFDEDDEGTRDFGIDLLINPDLVMAEEIINLSLHSTAFDLVEFAHGRVLLLGYQIGEDNPLVGSSLSSLGKRHLQGQYVITAIIREGKTIIPGGDEVIQAGDKIYLMVRKHDLALVEQLLGLAGDPPGFVILIGGGRLGYIVARQLEELGLRCKIIEQDRKRCEFLAENLAASMVLNFDGLDSKALLEEGIDNTDLVLALTDSDSTNILSSLLAKHHGAKRCITKIGRSDFVPLLDELGVDAPLNPRQVTADMILKFAGKDNLVSVATLEEVKSEVREIQVFNNKKLVDKAIKDLELPPGVIIGAIIRGREVIIPSGDSVIRLGDNLVIFFTEEAADKVDSFFSLDNKNK